VKNESLFFDNIPSYGDLGALKNIYGVYEFETSCKRAFERPSSKRDLNTF